MTLTLFDLIHTQLYNVFILLCTTQDYFNYKEYSVPIFLALALWFQMIINDKTRKISYLKEQRQVKCVTHTFTGTFFPLLTFS